MASRSTAPAATTSKAREDSVALSFPYPVNGAVKRPNGQGCTNCESLMELQNSILSPVTGRTFKHGRNGYVFHKCRCGTCSDAEREYEKSYKERFKKDKRWLEVGFNHGANGYRLGCRCETCKESESNAKKIKRALNGDVIRERERANLQLHADAHRERVKKYNKENRDGQKRRQKRYDETHQEQVKARRKIWYLQHLPDILAWQSNYQKNRYHTDPCYRLSKNLRSRVGRAIARDSKSDGTLALLGCSVQELKDKLESKFSNGMSWDNCGRWSIDHIIPCAAFDLTNPVHQRACFNWRNLQPMWLSDNQKKGDVVPPGIDVEAYISKFSEVGVADGS